MTAAETSQKMLKVDLTFRDGLEEGESGKTLQRKCLALMSPVTPVKVYCCLFIIAVLTTSVVTLSIVLSVLMREEKPVMESPKYAACPKSWIGFGSKCFYFSEDTRNWTFSQVFCVSLEASLAQFATMEELNFLKRYKGPSDHWIGLRRESSDGIWRWTDNTEHNNTFPIRGVGECAYLNDNGVGSASIYTDRKWICSKPNSYVYSCQIRNSLQNFPMDVS
ncbi:C-type lectin domain family 2 member E-like isoform X1 [Sapajus apella]|uniref:C-type lectin domain family 2 member E-like isoform X1 n=1 Tax=Sapajus apella TaxID=9515 RepID=A0A6J3HD31_SAPAP|nr:C-type lectin domain family 2 member E-like isoform X1 [Sapajus apella]